MSQLTGTRILNALKGLFSGLDSTDDTLLKKLLGQKKIRMSASDAATAGTAFTKTLIWYNDTGVDHRVVSAKAAASVAVTGHASNYATFQISKLDSAGANATAIGSYATDAATTKDMVANVFKDLTLTASAVIVPAGSYLVGEITKAASGVAVTAATSYATFEVRVEPT